jgi:hypothetical protein
MSAEEVVAAARAAAADCPPLSDAQIDKIGRLLEVVDA